MSNDGGKKRAGYKRYHPLTWIILSIPVLILTLGIGFYNTNRIAFGMSLMVWFFIIMDIITVILTYIAYRIEKRNISIIKMQKHQ